MAGAYFYQLDGAPPEAVLPRLLGMARARGWRIEVRGLSRERMEALDLLLWGEGGEFLPHGLSGGPHDADQPILLTAGAGAGGRDCLVAIDGAAVSEGEARLAERVCIVFDGADPRALATARGQWKSLTGAGLAARFHVREGGGWSLRQERPASP